MKDKLHQDVILDSNSSFKDFIKILKIGKRGSSLFDRESIENGDYILWVFIIRWQQKQGAGLFAQINHQSCCGI